MENVFKHEAAIAQNIRHVMTKTEDDICHHRLSSLT